MQSSLYANKFAFARLSDHIRFSHVLGGVVLIQIQCLFWLATAYKRVVSLQVHHFIEVLIPRAFSVVELRLQNLYFLEILGGDVVELKLIFSFKEIIWVLFQILIKSQSLLEILFPWRSFDVVFLRSLCIPFQSPFIGGIRVFNLLFDGKLRRLHLRP